MSKKFYKARINQVKSDIERVLGNAQQSIDALKIPDRQAQTMMIDLDDARKNQHHLNEHINDLGKNIRYATSSPKKISKCFDGVGTDFKSLMSSIEKASG